MQPEMVGHEQQGEIGDIAVQIHKETPVRQLHLGHYGHGCTEACQQNDQHTCKEQYIYQGAQPHWRGGVLTQEPLTQRFYLPPV